MNLQSLRGLSGNCFWRFGKCQELGLPLEWDLGGMGLMSLWEIIELGWEGSRIGGLGSGYCPGCLGEMRW